MSKIKIEVNGANSMNFYALLNEVNYRFEMVWSSTASTYICTVYDQNGSVTLGRAMRLDQDIFGNIPNVGFLTVEGDEPTIENFNVSCFFYYYEI